MSQVELIKQLRERTGAGLLDCKKAIEEANGDIEKAIEILRKKGIAKAEKKIGRVTKEGIIEAYIHPGAQLGVLVELNCETDFVARTDEFKKLAREIAMQIAATNPIAVKREDIPSEVVEKEKEIYAAQAKEMGKPDHIVERIVQSKLENFYKENVLLEQPYIRDPSITVMDFIKQHIAKFGENITVRRFARFRLGEE
ncbi:translation elongation factor Ts [bacterium]|nr:MAG: translation elongation factor Ts [bacterium]RKZ22612.1 MAG: translation elongation factor Ts [bacterium]RKZ26477.1 MAG: translation elongation factor Ts [bacterium]